MMKALLLSLRLLLAAGILPLTATPLHAAEPAATRVRHVNPEGAATLLGTKKDVVVLDIRTPKEFKGGHIDKAVNIDFHDKNFSEQLDKLDKSKTYLVHCASGGRSTKSLELFKAKGFKDIYHLDGGFNAWETAGKPVSK